MEDMAKMRKDITNHTYFKITLVPPLGSLALNRAKGFTLRSVPGYVPPNRWSWLLVKYKYPSLDVETTQLVNVSKSNTNHNTPFSANSHVSDQLILGSLTKVLTVPFAGLKATTAFCSKFPI